MTLQVNCDRCKTMTLWANAGGWKTFTILGHERHLCVNCVRELDAWILMGVPASVSRARDPGVKA